MSKVMARVIAQAFDSTAVHLYDPGDMAEIDSDGPLASLKTPLGKWVFDFPRPGTPAFDPGAPSELATEIAKLKTENAELARSSSGPAVRK